MDALTSLERAVVWRLERPSRAELDSFGARLAADLASPRTPPATRPFVVLTPAGLRDAALLERALAIRGARVIERHSLDDWPRAATAVHARSFDLDSLARAHAYEELWRGLFPRGEAEQWILEDDRALERARAWKPALRQIARGVAVTVQGLFDSFDAALHALHVPDTVELERQWRALRSIRRA